jgi:hypothetical protein
MDLDFFIFTKLFALRIDKKLDYKKPIMTIFENYLILKTHLSY